MRELPPLISWLSPGCHGQGYYTALILFLISFTPISTYSNCATNSETKNNVIITSLLNLHDETTKCARVSLRALQQRAIIEKTVAEINSNLMFSEAMRLSANIVDSCSSNDQGLNAALRSLLTMNQTCTNAPLLLGFIGPENLNQLMTLQQITSSLQKFHLLPFIPNLMDNNDNDGNDHFVSEPSVLYIGNSRTAIRSKIILAVLNQMKWKSVYAVIGEDSGGTIATLRYLLPEVDRLCITGMSKIPKILSKINDQDRIFYDDVIRNFRSSGADGLLMLADSVSDVRPLLNIMRDSSLPRTPDSSNPAIVLYLNQIGLKSWELPINYSILTLIESSEILDLNSRDLLQQSSTSFQSNTLTKKYYEQNEVDFKLDAFVDILDASVLALQYAIKLYWNAAKYARNIKCRLGLLTLSADGGICPEMFNTSATEWKSFLYKATYHDVSTMRKVSLRMSIPVNVRMYLTDSIVNSPQLIGRINDMGITELHVNLANTFKKAMDANGNPLYPKRCLSPTVVGGSRVPFDVSVVDDISDRGFGPGRDSSLLANIMAYGRSLFHLDESVLEKMPYIHVIILCSVAVVVFLTCLTLVVKCVYRTFKVESSEEREQARSRRDNGRNLSTISS
ncbi:uncharacterized protein LOC135846484 isoform X2 [Planococcus citri]|uniref:uncharacterized protein LOC135846484 isoform X2 n=1 Tax=Planococcus citri TaxID=170843 RepID=UPI0031F91A16